MSGAATLRCIPEPYALGPAWAPANTRPITRQRRQPRYFLSSTVVLSLDLNITRLPAHRHHREIMRTRRSIRMNYRLMDTAAPPYGLTPRGIWLRARIP